MQSIASLIHDIRLLPQDVKTLLSLAMHVLLVTKGETPFMTHTARELLFEGYNIQGVVDIVKYLADLAGIALPELPEDPRFGFFYGVYLNMLLLGYGK